MISNYPVREYDQVGQLVKEETSSATIRYEYNASGYTKYIIKKDLLQYCTKTRAVYLGHQSSDYEFRVHEMVIEDYDYLNRMKLYNRFYISNGKNFKRTAEKYIWNIDYSGTLIEYKDHMGNWWHKDHFSFDNPFTPEYNLEQYPTQY
jgi:YD repeat-containing protein